jgi:hypothetical protein
VRIDGSCSSAPSFTGGKVPRGVFFAAPGCQPIDYRRTNSGVLSRATWLTSGVGDALDRAGANVELLGKLADAGPVRLGQGRPDLGLKLGGYSRATETAVC